MQESINSVAKRKGLSFSYTSNKGKILTSSVIYRVHIPFVAGCYGLTQRDFDGITIEEAEQAARDFLEKLPDCEQEDKI